MIPSYVKDTNDFLWKIRSINMLLKDCLLVTLDVSSVYTNIPHNEGIDVCREALNTRSVLFPPIEDITQLITLILQNSNFSFNSLHYSLHYLQTHGTAMGTRMAPSYTNIFMGKLESSLLQQVTRKPETWWRYMYIDGTREKSSSLKVHACRDGAVRSKGNKVEMKTQKTNLIQKESGEERQEETRRVPYICSTYHPYIQSIFYRNIFTLASFIFCVLQAQNFVKIGNTTNSSNSTVSIEPKLADYHDRAS